MSSHNKLQYWKLTANQMYFDQDCAPANIIGNSVLSPWAVAIEHIITFPESVQCLWCRLIVIPSRIGGDYDNDDSSNNS